MVYQSAATFYWVIAAVLLLSNGKEGATYRGKAVNIFAAGFLATGIYACIFKILGATLPRHFITTYEPQKIGLDILPKLTWFFQDILPRVLNLWSIFPTKIIALSVTAFLMGAAALKLISMAATHNRRGLVLKITVHAIGINLLLVLSFLPNLVAVANVSPNRCLASLAALCLILLIWALKIYLHCVPGKARGKTLTAVLCLLCFYAVNTAHSNIDKFRVQPSRLEYTFFKDSLKLRDNKMTAIHIVQPQFDDFYHYDDEFGVLTSSWATDLIPFINCVLNEIAAEEGMHWVGLKADLKGNIFSYTFKDRLSQAGKFYTLNISLTTSHDEPPLGYFTDTVLIINLPSLYTPLRQLMGKQFDVNLYAR